MTFLSLGVRQRGGAALSDRAYGLLRRLPQEPVTSEADAAPCVGTPQMTMRSVSGY